jgi:hypothetical protein
MTGSVRSKEATAKTAQRLHRPVVDQFGTNYPSVGHAARSIGVATSTLCGVLSGRRPATKGYVFKYAAEKPEPLKGSLKRMARLQQAKVETGGAA